MPRCAEPARYAAASTVAEILAEAVRRLGAAGVEGPRRDARLLIAHALGLDTASLIGRPERPLSGAERQRVRTLVERRVSREPVSRILGRREFWGLELRIGPRTLDPRPDSETLVEAVLARLADRAAPLELLDLGTGSGCLLLALLSELPNARGLGTDIEPGALRVARANAAALGLAGRVRFERRDWGRGLRGAWQVIVSNPPYIIDKVIESLAPEVARFDPRPALSGGEDGLAAYRVLVPQVAALLAPGGLLALEVGQGQADQVESLVVAAGLDPLPRARDLAGCDRCVLAESAGGVPGAAGDRRKK